MDLDNDEAKKRVSLITRAESFHMNGGNIEDLQSEFDDIDGEGMGAHINLI